MKAFLFIICLFALLGPQSLHAQSDPTTALHVEIMKMDSLLFSVAFNTCDLELYKRIVSPELEFYDDRSGLNTSIEKDIAGFLDKCSKPVSITRMLVETEVDKLGDFGAVQTGTHIFLVDGKPVESAKFITVWEKKGDGWIMKRAISYAHKHLE